jgi:hypothetical protein
MSNENQHWVPKFLIRNFADVDGRVFRLDVQTNDVTKPPPKFAASGPDFYEFEIEGQAVTFEDRLGKIETAAAPILQRIITACSLAGLSEQDKRRVADFVASQSFRTEAFYKGLNPDLPRTAFGATFRELWRSAFLIADEVVRRHWALMLIDTDDIFYLGDNPVVLQRTADPKDGLGLGFDVRGVEAFLPLSPKCALYMPCTSTAADILERYHAAMELHRVVRSNILRGVLGGTNELATAQLVISRLHPLVRAFTTGVPLIANSANVENLNYLQCSWAHAAIYSNRREFTFAHRVFSENPQYRNIPKTSLVQKNILLPDSALEN